MKRVERRVDEGGRRRGREEKGRLTDNQGCRRASTADILLSESTTSSLLMKSLAEKEGEKEKES